MNCSAHLTFLFLMLSRFRFGVQCWSAFSPTDPTFCCIEISSPCILKLQLGDKIKFQSYLYPEVDLTSKILDPGLLRKDFLKSMLLNSVFHGTRSYMMHRQINPYNILTCFLGNNSISLALLITFQTYQQSTFPPNQYRSFYFI